MVMYYEADRKYFEYYLGEKTSEQIWEMLDQKQAPDPLTGAEAIVLNDIKRKMDVTLITEGIPRGVCESMGFPWSSPPNWSVSAGEA